jgi:hypothetical protein
MEDNDAEVDDFCFEIIRDLTWATYIEEDRLIQPIVDRMHELSKLDHRPDLYAREMLRYRVGDVRGAPGSSAEARRWWSQQIRILSPKVVRVTKNPADVYDALEQAVRPRLTSERLWDGPMIVGASIALACLTEDFETDMQTSRSRLSHYCKNCPNWVRAARLSDAALMRGPRI